MAGGWSGLSSIRRNSRQFRQRLPMPWMRSVSARADRHGVRDRNAECRHDDPVRDPRERENDPRNGAPAQALVELQFYGNDQTEGSNPTLSASSFSFLHLQHGDTYTDT